MGDIIKIFESPDGGNTVYVRENGSAERTLIDESADPDYLRIQRWILWKAILAEGPKCPALADLIRQAEEIYEIIKE